MKVIYNKHLPPKGFGAINLFGMIFARKDYGQLTDAEKNHEKIHTRQIIETLFFFYYIMYVIEWVVRLIQYRDKIQAYYNISFEREAYDNMYNPDYSRQRSLFSFIHYYKRR